MRMDLLSNKGEISLKGFRAELALFVQRGGSEERNVPFSQSFFFAS